MLKGLQTRDGINGTAKATYGPTEIIIDDEFIDKVLAIIHDVDAEIRICAYAWRWYENEPEIGIQRFNVALFRYLRRGYQIKILVDTERMKEQFKTLGFDARCVVNTRMLHTKAICVDRKSLVIGSHNLTKRANTDNYEMSILTQDFTAIDSFCGYFDRLWASRG